MKKYSFLLLIMLVAININPIQAVHSAPIEAERKTSNEETKKVKEKKFQKLLNKMEKKAFKMSKKKEKKDFFGGITDEPRFRLGLLLFGGGALISLLFGGIIGWAGAIVAVVGIVFMVLALVNY